MVAYPAAHRLLRFAAAPLLALALGLAGVTADAQPLRPDDQVTLTLSVERWVETDTPRVTITLNAAQAAADGTSVRAEMMRRLDGLGDSATPWRITDFSENRDSAGLTRWFARAEARLPAEALDGLADRVDAAGEAGLQLVLQAIDFTPTLAELEAARADLRAALYGDVAAEVAALRTVFPDRPFRVGRIDFTGQAGPPPAPMMAMEARGIAMTADAPAGGAGAVSQKLTLTAIVHINAAAPGDE